MICQKHNVEKTGKKPKCSECNKEYQRKWFAENRKIQQYRVSSNNRKYREAAQTFLFEYLLEHPCIICKEADVLVLDFDHLKDKKANLCTLAQRGKNIDFLKKEIEKCQVLCSNCHRRKTSKESNSFRYRKLNESNELL